jgi:hypothetical protein
MWFAFIGLCTQMSKSIVVQQINARAERAGTLATRPIPVDETNMPAQHYSELRVIALAAANSATPTRLLPTA